MTVGTLTLSEFLLARIAEDEEQARGAESKRPVVTKAVVSGVWLNSRYHMTVQPARVLAECQAKRWIVGMHSGLEDPQDCAPWGRPESEPCDTLIAVASVYSDHPDYNPAWRPDA